MIHRHERGIPSRYLKSPSTQARHDAKLYSLLDYIYRFQYTSTSVIELLWDVDRSVVNKMIRRYVKDDVLLEVPTYATRDKRILLLKPKGVRLLEQFHNERLKYNAKQSTINPKTITHDLIVGAIVAMGVQSEKYAFFITEREQEKDTVGKNRRVDAICFDIAAKQMVAVEVECSSKSIPHRHDLLLRYRKAIDVEHRYEKILIFSHKRRFVKDAERVNNKVIEKHENELDADFYNKHIKYIYNKELIALIYNKFWIL